jgi:hypothetical protein
MAVRNGPLLLAEFGTTDAVKPALNTLRAQARAAGLPGVTVAADYYPKSQFSSWLACGYEVLTAYSYHEYPVPGHEVTPASKQRSFVDMIPRHQTIWNATNMIGLPYIPVVTTGYDRRPWEALDAPDSRRDVYYPDRTTALVEQFIDKAIALFRAILPATASCW